MRMPSEAVKTMLALVGAFQHNPDASPNLVLCFGRYHIVSFIQKKIVLVQKVFTKPFDESF